MTLETNWRSNQKRSSYEIAMSIYWADRNEGKFAPPLVGSFENNVAHFFIKDVYEQNKKLK
jgi:hypothetical protein